MTTTIRVLVADDHPLYRDGLRIMIEATDDMELAAEAQDGEEALVPRSAAMSTWRCSTSTCRASTGSTPRAGSRRRHREWPC